MDILTLTALLVAVVLAATIFYFIYFFVALVFRALFALANQNEGGPD